MKLWSSIWNEKKISIFDSQNLVRDCDVVMVSDYVGVNNPCYGPVPEKDKKMSPDMEKTIFE